MYNCEVCGKAADKHHIVHRCEGGLEFQLNIKYLCPEHHRGKKGPHRDCSNDIRYKLELQNRLQSILCDRYYMIDKLELMLQIKSRILKKLLKDCRLYKEGYKTEDIVYRLMGDRLYVDSMLEQYEDFIPLFKLAL